MSQKLNLEFKSHSELFSLAGKTAAVIGGGGHVCSALARGFASAGANIAIIDLRIEKAEAVAKELGARKADLLIVSPMVRTVQTAERIAKATGLKIELDEAWREAGFGEWDGLKISEVKELYPNEWLAWVSSTAAPAGSGGESYEDVAARSELAITNLVLEHPGKTIIVVTHNYVIISLVAVVLGAPLESVYHLDVLPCSITTVNTWASDGLRALRGLSERSHLK